MRCFHSGRTGSQRLSLGYCTTTMAYKTPPVPRPPRCLWLPLSCHWGQCEPTGGGYLAPQRPSWLHSPLSHLEPPGPPGAWVLWMRAKLIRLHHAYCPPGTTPTVLRAGSGGTLHYWVNLRGYRALYQRPYIRESLHSALNL